MCIAIAKVAGVNLPNDDILRTCFHNNPDGAGFAFAYNGRVYIKKGFMSFDNFIRTLHSYNEQYDLKNCGMLIHFRIATSGSRGPDMTHPFPIVADEGALRKIEYVSDYAVIHNGIIYLTTSYYNKNGGLSDTATFIRDYLTKIAGNNGWFRNKCNMELIEKLIESKMAILNKDGSINMTSGFTEDNGVYYSNSSYKDNYTRFTKRNSKYDKNSYGSWEDYYNEKSYGDYYSYPYGGYNDFDDDDDEIIDMTKSDYSSKYKNGKVALMAVKAGCYIDSTNLSEEITGDELDEYFVDSNFNLYLMDSTNGMLYYLDTVEIYDKNIKKVEFSPDTWVFAEEIDYFEE